MTRSPEGADVLGHGARILKVDVLRSDLDVEQTWSGCRRAHQLHERRQADAGPHHSEANVCRNR